MCPGSDYHILIERYDPRSSDPVKALYNIKQTSGQRKAYFKSVGKIFVPISICVYSSSDQ